MQFAYARVNEWREYVLSGTFELSDAASELTYLGDRCLHQYPRALPDGACEPVDQDKGKVQFRRQAGG